MDNQLDTKNQSAAEEASRLLRQIDAGARAAETIEKAKRSSATTINLGATKRSAPSLRTDINFVQSEDLGRVTTDEQYRAQGGPYADMMVQQTGKTGEPKPNKPGADQEEESALDYPTRTRRVVRQAMRGNIAGAAASTLSLAQTAASRARASTINIAAFSWGIPVWLFVQLPFGLISLICLGVIAGVETLTANTGGLLGWLTSKVAEVTNTILQFIGIDLANIALGLFGATYIITLTAGLVTVFILGLQYKLGLLHPIFGTGSTLKIAALILTIAGLGLPVLNLIPFVILWMAAVWVYPR